MPTSPPTDVPDACLILHLPAQKAGDSLHELLFSFPQRRVLLLKKQHHAAHQVASGQNGGRDAHAVALQPVHFRGQ